MAIRDFGTSLLANVRQRKDAQARDARNRAKKQQRKPRFQNQWVAKTIENTI